MSEWYISFRDSLKEKNVSNHDFMQVVHRLLENGVLCNKETIVESELYDVAIRVSCEIEEYLEIIGFRYFHDHIRQYIKVYPPGSSVPTLQDDEINSTSFRKKLGQQEIALALGLRLLYQQKLGEGNIDDDGESAVSIDELNSVMLTVIKQEMPKTATEYGRLVSEMRKLKILRYDGTANLLEGDTWLFIRPIIINTVSEDVLSAVVKQNVDMKEESVEEDAHADR